MKTNSFGPGKLAYTRQEVVLLWIGLVALLLMFRPYAGIYHDAHLYAAQVLRHLGYDALQQDVYFAYGNQDEFTTFTLLYAPLVQALGLSAADKLVYGLGLAFWFGSIILLVRNLFDSPKARILALAGALALSPSYGTGILSYGEAFATPRIFSESFGILSLIACLHRRYWLSAATILPAVILHPVMGLCLMAVLSWLVLRNLWLYLGLCLFALGIIAGLGALQISPFSWFWESLDETWFNLIKKHDPMVIVMEWGKHGAATLPLKLVILFVIIKFDSGRRADFAKAILSVTCVLLAFSVMGADILANRFFVGIQLWRVLFLTALLANIFALRAAAIMPDGRARFLLVLALLVNFAEVMTSILGIFSAALALLALFALMLEAQTGRPLGLARKLSISFPTLFVLVFFGLAVASKALVIGDPQHVLRLGASIGALGGICIVLWWRGFQRLACGLTIGSLVIAVVTIDRRNDMVKYAASNEPPSARISALLENKTVYWESGLQLMWFKFRMPQYYSCRQKGGMVFFRGQAVEILRRGEVLSQLNSMDFAREEGSQCPNKADRHAIGPRGKTAFADICTKLPELDLMVLHSRLPGLYREVFLTPFIHQHRFEDAPTVNMPIPVYIYRCADFRA